MWLIKKIKKYYTAWKLLRTIKKSAHYELKSICRSDNGDIKLRVKRVRAIMDTIPIENVRESIELAQKYNNCLGITKAEDGL